MKGNIAIVTGGASGIGLSTARLLASRGATVFCFDRKCLAPEPGLNFVECDVGEENTVSEKVQRIIHSHGKIDYLVANCGIHFSGNLEESPTQVIHQLFLVNFMGVVNSLKSVLPHMRLKQKGAIVLTSSDQAFVAKKNNAIYGAMKAAVAHLAKSTALDYSSDGIRANAVCPGTIDTPFYRNAIQLIAQKRGLSEEALHESLSHAQPLSRVGRPDEVAELIVFLCSEASSFMTGTLVPIDGGFLAQ